MSRWWYPGTAPKESRPWIIEWRDGKGFVRNDGRQTSISTPAGMGNFGGVLYLLTSGISSRRSALSFNFWDLISPLLPLFCDKIVVQFV